MPQITDNYIESLPEIYRDILKAYVVFNPQKRLGAGVALQSLYAALFDKYSASKIRVACEKLAEGGVLQIEDDYWTRPTVLGEELIGRLTEGERPEDQVPPFHPPPAD